MNETVITSRQNPVIQRFRKLQSSRAARYENALYCADGTKLLDEALRWNGHVRTVLLMEGASCGPLPEEAQCFRISRELMQYVSDMQAPQGVLFSCAMPEPVRPKIAPGTLILDGIQDPGNLGTILRTADAFDIPVICSDGCADPYNTKTVRASMGAVFRTQPVLLGRDRLLQACHDASVPLAVTALSADSVDIRSVQAGRYAIVIGSEGHGVCRAFCEAAEKKLVIPMQPRCESLNASIAAAIVMWQLRA